MDMSKITQKSNRISAQLIRYFLVGGSAFWLDFILLIALTELAHLHYLLSAGIGATAGMFYMYFLSVKWVFSHRTVTSRKKEVTLFFGIGIIGIVLAQILIFTFTEHLLIHYAISKIMAQAIVFFWNFSARKLILFKNK